MTFEIEYFHERVLHDIESWPVDFAQAHEGGCKWLN
jgi:hypothetical protein